MKKRKKILVRCSLKSLIDSPSLFNRLLSYYQPEMHCNIRAYLVLLNARIYVSGDFMIIHIPVSRMLDMFQSLLYLYHFIEPFDHVDDSPVYVLKMPLL